MTETRTALLLGATGLVGSHVLKLLSGDEHWDQVVTLGRREMPTVSSKHVHHVADFDEMDVIAEHFACDDLFCCLGTTIKQAGSKEAFRLVDLGIPVEAAYLAHAQGASHYALVSALGANHKSRIFYNRVKGETENALADVGFSSLAIFRPSLLTGDRVEYRRGEVVADAVLSVVKPLLIGPFRKYRPTPASDLARVMVRTAYSPAQGASVYEADAIMARAREM